jgi:hypothetical protein
MTVMPAAAAFQAEPMTAQAISDLLVQLRDCLAGLLGTDGTVASALAALGALGGQAQALTSATTLAVGDRGKVILASGTFTLGLPAAASAGSGWSMVAVNTGSGTITLDGSGAETVDGAATVALAPGRAAILVCTGSAWVSLALPGTAGGPLIAPAGTVAAPGLSPAGDTNTGIEFPAADQIGLVTGGTRRVLLSTTAMQIDLPITGTAVSASAADTTAGRVMRLGDWGLGAAIANALPSNDFTAEIREGFWRLLESSAVGHPSTDPYYMGALAMRAGGSEAGAVGGHGVLTWRGIGSTLSTQRLRFGARVTNTGALNWVEIMTNARLAGTVSQSGGVPTGAVFEYGSNANGEYVRLADGTQICWASFVESALAITTAAGALYQSASFGPKTFPAVFAAAPALLTRGGCATNADGWMLRNGTATTTATTNGVHRAIAFASRTEDFRWAYLAIGRWF